MGDFIVVLSKDDNYMHVGTAAALFAHREWDWRRFDVFDDAGRIARPTARRGPRPSPRPSPRAVAARVRRCLDSMADDLETRSDLVEYAHMGPVLRSVRGDLPEVLRQLAVDDFPQASDSVVAQHSSGFFHNLVHKVRGD